MSRTRGSSPQQRSVAVFAVPVAGLLFAAAVALRLPGFVAAWAGCVAFAFAEPSPLLTGKKDQSGYPSAANPAEQRRLNRYQLWRELRRELLLPLPHRPAPDPWRQRRELAGLSWSKRTVRTVRRWGDSCGMLPVAESGVPVSAVLAAIAAVFAACSPVLYPRYGLWLRSGNALCAYVLICQSAFAMRRLTGSPGSNIMSLPKARTQLYFWPRLATGLALSVGAVYAALRWAPASWAGRSTIIILAACLAAVILIGLIYRPWSDAALDHWRVVKEADAEWRLRWESLKQPVVPGLIDQQMVGPATVDTFEIPGGYGSTAFLALGKQIAPTIGAGTRVAVLSVPDMNAGEERPGTIHPNRFQVVTWPVSDVPDLAGPDVDDDTAVLLAHCCMYWTTDPRGFARMVPTQVERITAADSPHTAWASTWASPGGLTIATMRDYSGAADLAPIFGCEVLLDPVNEVAYFGALTDPGTVFASEDPGAARMAELAAEDRWDADWNAVLKTSPPTIQHAQSGDAELADGSVVHKAAFVCRIGQKPSEFFGKERALGNTSLQAAPFIAITGFPVRHDRPGERHPQAFTLYWSESRPPNIDRLAPAAAAAWVVAGKINEAFAAVRLARPELVKATALTSPESGSHIWEVQMRHYDGVTMGDVRSQSERLRQALGVPWLRVAEASDGSTIYLGGEPSRVELAHARRDMPRLKALDWDQAWLDASVTGSGNTVPQLVDFATMPSNPDVEVLTFTLPPGLDLAGVREKIGKLKPATGNDYIDVRPSARGASHCTVIACERNPMPTVVPYDFDREPVPGEVPFATGIDGEPVIWRRDQAPHLLLAGVTGAGKSAAAANILYGALVGGAELVIIDPTKGAADFAFLVPYAKAIVGLDADKEITTHVVEAAAAMRAVYAEGLRRRKLNAAHGAGSFTELPEGIRPRPWLVLVDEFIGLIGIEKVAKQPFDDPEMEYERQISLAVNIARQRIGQMVSKIAAEARAWGIFLVLGTQKLPAALLDNIPNGANLKVNLARILLGKATPGDRMSALRVPEDVPPMGDAIGKGRGIWEPLESSSELIQAWYATQSQYSEQLARIMQPLHIEDQLDYAKLIQHLPSRPLLPGEVGGPDEDDAVIDLGLMEFTLEDLEATDEGAAAEGGANDPGDMPLDVPITGEIVIAVDVDGVLAPYGDGRRTDWPDMTGHDVPGMGTVYRSGQLSEAVAALGKPVWLTDWGEDAPLFFPEMADAEVLAAPLGDGQAWHKTAALVGWVIRHPQTRALVWLDDQLAEPDVDGTPRSEAAATQLDAHGVRYLLFAPDRETGLSPADLDRIRTWVNDSDGVSECYLTAARIEEPSRTSSTEPDVPDDEFEEIVTQTRRTRVTVPPAAEDEFEEIDTHGGRGRTGGPRRR